MQAWTNAAGEPQNAPPKPAPEKCQKCGGPVEPVLMPGIGNQPARYIASNWCEACTQAEYEAQGMDVARQATRRRMEAAELPKAAHGWDFERVAKEAAELKQGEDLEQWRQAYRACRYWSMTRGLYLYGEAGLGKTVLAYCLVKQAVEFGKAALFLPVRELFLTVMDSYAMGSPARLLVERAKKADFLALDDLGAVTPRKKTYDALFTVVDYRVSAKLPTVYTSNYSPAELHKRLRDKFGRVVDRIIEAEGVPFSGTGFRLLDARQRW